MNININKILIPDKIFQTTLIISMLLHCSILLRYPQLLWRRHSVKKIEKEIKVAYIKEIPQVKNFREPFLNQNLPLKVNDNKQIPPPFINKENLNFLDKQTNFDKPIITKPEVLTVKKRITMPEIEIDKKMKNPTYMGYYQLIREKIRKSAYSNYSHYQTGEVYVSFLVSREGTLKDVKFIEEKSTQSEYLKNLSLNSVRQAAPFPVFPKELDFDQLSFNVVISFEID